MAMAFSVSPCRCLILTQRCIVYNDTIQQGESTVTAKNTGSRIVCNIDFDKNGRQAGYCRAPLSRNTAGWGTVEIPIIVVKNGEGPTALLTGGVHGD